MRLRDEVLGRAQRVVLARVAPLARKHGFYLAGGIGLALAAPEDIAAMKLAAVAERGSKKDFVDVFALGQRFSLEQMLGFYRVKYDVGDVGHVLVALAYFDDADRERTPTLLRRWSWPKVKATLLRWVEQAASGA